MGQLCPTCGTHQAFKEHKTATGEAAVKATDVIHSILACGHSFGSEEFMAYKKIVTEIQNDAARRIQEIQDDMKNTIQAQWTRMTSKPKKGDGN